MRMASKKINWHLAHTIACEISTKAFEHLIAPLEKLLDEIGTEVADVILGEIDLDVLLNYNIVQKHSGFRPISIRIAEDGSKDSAITVNAEMGFSLAGWNILEAVVSYDVWSRANSISQRLTALRVKRAQMADELKTQLEGSTTATAIKAWPEAEDIILEAAGITNSGNFTVPLDSLLMKYLPMLPAPKGE